MKSTGRAYYGHMSLLPSIYIHSNNGMPLIVESKERTSGRNCKWVVLTWKYWHWRREVCFIRWSPHISTQVPFTGDQNNSPSYCTQWFFSIWLLWNYFKSVVKYGGGFIVESRVRASILNTARLVFTWLMVHTCLWRLQWEADSSKS